MRRTYGVPFSRAGLAGLTAALVLLCLPGTSIAGGASDTSSASTASSGLLQYGAGYGKADGAPHVRVVQRTLRGLGWQPGPVDGLYGPRTKAAVTRFQTAARVAADGIVGPQTRHALTQARNEPLRRGAGFALPDGSPRVRALQATLQRRGLRPGPVDGLFGPRTQAAVERLQRSGGVPVSGVATDSTRNLLASAGTQPDEPTQTPDEPAKPDTGQTADGNIKAGDRRNASTPTAPDTVERSDSGGVSVPIVVLIGLLAMAIGLLAGALVGRRNRVVSGTAVPLRQGVVAEGTSNSKSVGRFKGTVHALVLGRRGFRHSPEARYLVSDPGKQDPFWVSQDEVSNIVPPTRPGRFQRAAEEGEQVLALGYISVPANGSLQTPGFEIQLNAIDRHCDRNGWELVEVVRDVDSPPGDVERQGLLYALEKIGRGEASCLIVSDLGRLSVSASGLGGILDRLKRSDGRLVALDIGLDTASPEGRVAAQALASVSSWEHERTRKGLAAAAAGSAATVEPQVVQDVPALKERIATMRTAGMTLQAIADVLNSEGVPTLRGGVQWRPSSVQSATGYRRPAKRPGEASSNGNDGPEGPEQ
jgi:peptidoglycan hydrolase-like protein with peptidoglycan-binding domain/DNA invertase Pin-like site-specific DNA recombinase